MGAVLWTVGRGEHPWPLDLHWMWAASPPLRCGPVWRPQSWQQDILTGPMKPSSPVLVKGLSDTGTPPAVTGTVCTEQRGERLSCALWTVDQLARCRPGSSSPDEAITQGSPVEWAVCTLHTRACTVLASWADLDAQQGWGAGAPCLLHATDACGTSLQRKGQEKVQTSKTLFVIPSSP